MYHTKSNSSYSIRSMQSATCACCGWWMNRHSLVDASTSASLPFPILPTPPSCLVHPLIHPPPPVRLAMPAPSKPASDALLNPVLDPSAAVVEYETLPLLALAKKTCLCSQARKHHYDHNTKRAIATEDYIIDRAAAIVPPIVPSSCVLADPLLAQILSPFFLVRSLLSDIARNAVCR